MIESYLGLVVCTCGQSREEIDIMACSKCGDACCEDCWIECEYCDEVVCMNCSGYATTRLCYQCEAIVQRLDANQQQSGYQSKGFLIIAGETGKRYEIRNADYLIDATGYSPSTPNVRLLDIKGLGKLRYSYRSMLPVYENTEHGFQREVGTDYFFYCYRLEDEDNIPF